MRVVAVVLVTQEVLMPLEVLVWVVMAGFLEPLEQQQEP
jgi:hypothetical protein